VTIAVVLSVIILSLVFGIWWKDIFNFSSLQNYENFQNVSQVESENQNANSSSSKIESPMTLLKKFWNESSGELEKLKVQVSDLKDLASSSSNK
jgi:CRISPR/Cas system type I-B associated protein Csh2 (Cas7 group RAMP superfamily)